MKQYMGQVSCAYGSMGNVEISCPCDLLMWTKRDSAGKQVGPDQIGPARDGPHVNGPNIEDLRLFT